jgi:hypothetical protein
VSCCATSWRARCQGSSRIYAKGLVMTRLGFGSSRQDAHRHDAAR